MLSVFHIVCLGWILFCADSFATVVIYLSTLVQGQDAAMQATPFTVGLIALGLACTWCRAICRVGWRG